MDLASLPFPVLLNLALDGDKEAAAFLHEQFASHLKRVIRRRLADPMRRFFDSHDFLQDAWKSFYAAPDVPRTFTRPEQLVRFLESIANHKVTDAFRRQLQTAKNNANRQVGLEDGKTDHSAEPIARAPSPSQLFAEQDLWNRLIAGQSAQNRHILELLRQGYTQQQAADSADVNERTVRRLVKTLAPLVRS